MNKYIDADKLKELISQVEKEFIEKSETKGYTTLEYRHKAEGLQLAIQFIDFLQQEQQEEFIGNYNEAYLQEKIAKARDTWKGVDVDKYMAELRGYELSETE